MCNIDTSGYTNLQLSVLVGSKSAPSNNRYEDIDELAFFYREDGATCFLPQTSL